MEHRNSIQGISLAVQAQHRIPSIFYTVYNTKKYLLLAWAMTAHCLDIKYVIHLMVRLLSTFYTTLEEINCITDGKCIIFQ